MRSAQAISLAALVMLAGCGDDGRIPTYPASGVVKFADGKPLVGGVVLCESPHGLAARAIIQEDGTFELGTYEQDDGAVAGKHRVTIQPAPSADADPDSGVKTPPAFDERFKSFDTSGITFDVKPDGENDFKIEITPPQR
jgi:hypothetical protein